MDKNESNNISSLVTNMEWVKKTLNDISSELKSFPMAIDSINKRIDSTESVVQALGDKLSNHIVNSEVLIKDHVKNTKFRESNVLLIGIGKWLLPGSIVFQLIIIIFKDKI